MFVLGSILDNTLPTSEIKKSIGVAFRIRIVVYCRLVCSPQIILLIEVDLNK